MTKNQVNKVLQENRIHVWKSYSFEVYFWLLLCFAPAIAASSSSKFDYSDNSILIITIISLFVGVIMAHGYYTERRLVRIKTNLSKKDNIAIIKRGLKEISWKHRTKDYTIEISDDNGYIVSRMLRIYIILVDEEIVFNVMLKSGRGHIPYLFGIKTYYNRKLKKAIVLAIGQYETQLFSK